MPSKGDIGIPLILAVGPDRKSTSSFKNPFQGTLLLLCGRLAQGQGLDSHGIPFVELRRDRAVLGQYRLKTLLLECFWLFGHRVRGVR